MVKKSHSESDGIFCPNCGNEIKTYPTTRICPACGVDIPFVSFQLPNEYELILEKLEQIINEIQQIKGILSSK